MAVELVVNNVLGQRVKDAPTHLDSNCSFIVRGFNLVPWRGCLRRAINVGSTSEATGSKPGEVGIVTMCMGRPVYDSSRMVEESITGSTWRRYAAFPYVVKVRGVQE